MAKIVRLAITCDLCSEEHEADYSVVIAEQPVDLCGYHFASLDSAGRLKATDVTSLSCWAQGAAFSTG